MRVAVHDTKIPGGLEVVSLTTGKNGRIYGGLTGAKGHLLCEYDPASGTTRDIGHAVVSAPLMHERSGKPYDQKIHHALPTLPDGRIAGGTGSNVSVGLRHVRINDEEGGHVFLYDPKTESGHDLGVPVAHMWIITATVSPDGAYLFGMTYYHNDFFHMDLATGEVVFADQVHGGVWGDSACCHTIVCDPRGRAYGSCSEGCIFVYDPFTRTLKETDTTLPGTGSFRTDSLVCGDDGMLYGGVWETGILFSLNPDTLEIRTLCQPNDGPRLPALVVRDGQLLGAAGGGSQYGTRAAFLFEYDPRKARYREIGPIRDEETGVEGQRIHARRNANLS